MEHANPKVETFEPFTSSFTGTLTTFKALNGRYYTLKKPYMRCEKGQMFVLAINPAAYTGRLIPLLMPNPRYLGQ